MTTPSNTVLSPLELRCGAHAKNRVVVAAMTNQQSHPDGTLSDDEERWLLARADGGFGVVTTCAAHVTQDGQGWPGELGVFDDKHIPGLKRLATGLRQRGALSLVQIFHGGLRADPSLGLEPWSASASEDGRVREATPADIERVIEAFASAAARSEAAGMDGVEIHGAHGYLLTQFLSATENRRTDRWGGDLDGRSRLIREVMRAVRGRVSPGFAVGVRLSPEDFGNAKGLDVDEVVRVAQGLSADGADFIHLSLWKSAKNTTKHPDRHALSLFREALPKDVSLWVAGAIWTRNEAEALLDLGADAVALARAAILNPDWPARIAEADYEPRRPPMSAADLAARALSPAFITYMRNWRGFVE